MTIAVATTKTGFDSTGDAVASGTMLTFGNSVDGIFNDILNGVQAADRFKFSSAITYTIASGAITSPSQTAIYIASETGTTDVLTTIGASNNRFIFMKAAAGHTITVQHGTGNLSTLDGNDIYLTGAVVLLAWCQGSQWSVVSTGAVKNNFLAASDPLSSSDTTLGYDYGSQWVNLNNFRAYTNIFPAAGASIWRKFTPNINEWSIRAAAATLQQVGIAAPTIANTPANANQTDGPYVTLPTTASSGNLGGFVTATFNLVRLAYDPIVEWLIKTDSTISSIRIWIGLASADVTNSDTASGSFIGFRYSTVAGDAGWMPVNRDGTTQTVGTAIGTVQASTVYKLRLRLVSGTPTCYFSVNDGAEQAFATNIPLNSTDLGMVCRPITQTTAIRLINYSYGKVGW